MISCEECCYTVVKQKTEHAVAYHNAGYVVRPVVRLVGRCVRRDVNRHCKQML